MIQSQKGFQSMSPEQMGLSAVGEMHRKHCHMLEIGLHLDYKSMVQAQSNLILIHLKKANLSNQLNLQIDQLFHFSDLREIQCHQTVDRKLGPTP